MYHILDSDNKSELVELVRTHEKKGWKPLGGVAITQYQAAKHFYQAIVKTTI